MDGLRISEANADQADELSAFATMTYVAAFGADFGDPADLQAHLEASLSPGAWRRYLAADRVFLANADDGLVGYLQLGKAVHPADFEVRRLYVHPAHQNEGVGAALLGHALEDVAVREAPAVWLDVWQDNLRAQRFYRRFGFEFTSERHPFILKSGAIDGYDLVMVRRQGGSA